MSNQEPTTLQLKPIITYPREAQVGKTYLVSIDVQLATPNTAWDFPEEEYTIGFILNTSPYFTCEPLHDVWPTIILHRYGGTYGPAEFLFTASEHEIERGQISITLVNGWGIPMTRLELPCEVNLESNLQGTMPEITVPPPQGIAANHDKRLPSIDVPQEEQGWVERIATMLAEAGWIVVDMLDTIVTQNTGIAIKMHPSIDINRYDDTFSTELLPQSNEELSRWYYSLSEYEQCFVQAMAVFRGASIGNIRTAAEELYLPLRELKRKQMEEEEKTASEPPLRVPRAEFFRRLFIISSYIDGIDRLDWRDRDTNGYSEFGTRLRYFIAKESIIQENNQMTQKFPEIIRKWINGENTAEITDVVLPAATQFLLMIDNEAVGIIIKEDAELLVTPSSSRDVLINSLGNSIWASLTRNTRNTISFIYEMQGKEIHFTNNLEPEARSRVVFYFHRPETFALWLEQSPVGMPNDLNNLVRSRLRRMPPVSETNLSASLVEAITNLEISLAQNRLRALIQMADSSSMLINSMYRLLKFGGARRILYLVKSKSIGLTLLEGFEQYTIPATVQSFLEVYKTCVSDHPDPSSNVCIMEIEDVYRLLSHADSEDNHSDENTSQTDVSITYSTDLPIELFDVIFLVECFDELRQQYRPLLDYFDAFLVGVGADIPSRVATLFNRNLVYQDRLLNASMVTQRLWNYCNLLRDEGLSYGDYLEQLTYLLFLKMADERTKLPFDYPARIPAGYDWQSLLDKNGLPLEEHYRNILKKLGDEKGMLGVIFRKAINRIQDPAKLRRLIVDLIEPQNWSGLGMDVAGDAYEGLLEKNAEDVKTGAGQYFTPRPLIKAIVDVMRPEPGTRICDPACGTGGFLLMAHEYIAEQPLTHEQAQALKNDTFSGWETVDNTARLCAMNLFLHDIGSDDASESPITVGDSLLKSPSEHFDMVLSNPPFGRKSSITIVNEARKENIGIVRSDFIADASNKQLNFVQHIITLLKLYGRAAVVVPDNVLFEGGAGEKIRSSLFKQCDVHTLLRLPTGIFYAQGIKANVLFFDRMPASDKSWTKELWIYDYRTNQNFTLRTHPLKREHLEDFVKCYHAEDRHNRRETEHFRKYSYDELIKRDKTNLDIFWLRDEKPVSDEQPVSPDTLANNVIEDLTDAMDKLRGLIPDDEKHVSRDEGNASPE